MYYNYRPNTYFRESNLSIIKFQISSTLSLTYVQLMSSLCPTHVQLMSEIYHNLNISEPLT